MGLLGIGCQVNTVDGQECICCGDGCPLVAVHEGLVLGKPPPERGRFLDQIDGMPGLELLDEFIERTAVADPMNSSVPLDLVGVDGKDFLEAEVVCHFASFLYSSSYWK